MARRHNWDSRIGRRLRLRDLHVLFAVVQQGSMAKAGAHLGMSQSAVSQAVAALEHAVEVRLLDRTPRGIELTPYGAALMRRGQNAFDELRSGVKDIEFLRSSEVGEVRIACTESVAAGILPAVIERFSQRYPKVRLSVYQTTTHLLGFAALNERSADLVLTLLPKPFEQDLSEHLQSEVLFHDRICLAASKQSPWVSRRKIRLADLADVPLISPASDTPGGAALAEAFRAAGLPGPSTTVTTFSVHLRSLLSMRARFVAVLPESVLRFNSDVYSLKALPLDLSLPQPPVLIVTLKNRTLSVPVERFVETARHRKEDVRRLSFLNQRTVLVPARGSSAHRRWVRSSATRSTASSTKGSATFSLHAYEKNLNCTQRRGITPVCRIRSLRDKERRRGGRHLPAAVPRGIAMQKRHFLVAVGFGAAALGIHSPLIAQTPERVARLGILISGSLEQRGDLDRAFVEGLRGRGYVEGRNLIIERRYDHEMSGDDMGSDGMTEHNVTSRLPRLARELADMKVDAIVTTCAPSTHAARNATSSIPIIMASVSDPVGQGLVASLARPGRNVTGLSSQANELLPKRLELVVGMLPLNALVAVLANSRNPVHPPMWQTLKEAAGKLNLQVMLISTDDGAGLSAAFDTAARAEAKGLYVLPDDPAAFNLRYRIVALAAHHRMLGIYWASEFVEAGGLMSYGANLRDAYAETAVYVDRVLKGANPATLAVAQPTRFELVINQKAAAVLGLVISPALLLRADRLIK